MLNVAGDEVTDIRAASELIGELLGIEPEIRGRATRKSADIVADNARLHAFLGDARLVSLREGLERMLASDQQG